MKNYLEFRIEANPFNVDILSSVIWELDITGINEFDDYLLVFANADGKTKTSAIELQLEKLKQNNLVETYSVSEQIIEEQNWNEEWEKKINVIEVSDRIVIKPSFKEYLAKPGQLILHIDPKMSFGTGEHETTKLMLKMTEKHTTPGTKVIDVGTGTGVLGICAAKLGAEKVLAIDNDEWCLLNGKENVGRNDVEKIVEVRLCEIHEVKENDFDMLLANINRNILLDISDEVVTRVKVGGKIILSGLLDSDEEIIKESYLRHNLKFLKKEQMNEWVALVFMKL